jgi:hypothetical protein
MLDIYEDIKASSKYPDEVICVRTKDAVTIACGYPRRYGSADGRRLMVVTYESSSAFILLRVRCWSVSTWTPARWDSMASKYSRPLALAFRL